MSLKDRIIKKLLNVGKKHRILIYPTLALVAVVSAISQMICWGKGNGKRVVASIMIMAMLVTQSLFLSSDAATTDDPTDPAAAPTSDLDDVEVPDDLDGAEDLDNLDDLDGIDDLDDFDGLDGFEGNEDLLGAIMPLGLDDDEPLETISVIYCRVDEGNVSHAATPINVNAKPDDSFDIVVPTDDAVKLAAFTSEGLSNFNISGCYSDLALSNAISGTINISNADAKAANGIYRIYYSITRTQYDVNVMDGDALIDSQKVPVTANAGEMYPDFSYTVDTAVNIGAYKTGYTYKGVNYNGSFAPGSSISVTAPASGTLLLQAEWTAQKINLTITGRPSGLSSEIDNTINVDGTESITIPYTYGEELTLPSNTMNENLSSEAYYISDWNINGTTYQAGSTLTAEEALAIVEGKADKSENPNITQKYPIEAVWSYKEIALTTNSEALAVGASAGDGATLTATYGDTFDVTLGANYKLDSMDSTGFTYTISQADTDILNQYGILPSAISSGGANQGIRFLCVAPGVSDVPTSPVKIKVTITDSKNSSVSQDCPITLNLLPKKLSIDPATVKTSDGQKAPSKEYDGNTLINVNKTADLEGVINSDEVKVSFDTEANFEDSAVGDNKDVTLKNLVLSGAQAHRYTIDSTVTLEDIGSISQKALGLVMRLKDGEVDQVKFGQKTPEYELDLDDASVAQLAPADKAIYDSYVAAGDTTGFVKDYVGFTNWSTPRDLYSDPNPNPKEYTVVPLISSTGKNYTASASGLSMTFKVSRDDGTTEYEMIGDYVNDIYKGLVIKPLNGYDQIRRVTAGDIAEGTAESTVLGYDWDSSITIEDMVDGTISFQMRSSGTGAITKVVTLNDINVDRKGPVIQKMSVSPKSYINSFGFGSYYHSQNSVEFMTMKIYYTSEDSKCTKLHYYFVDENGKATSETTVDFEANPADGNYVATLTIGTANRGQLVVYAENLATNISERSRIRMEQIDKLAATNDYYEWMVENNIENASIEVTDADGIAANSSVWYNKLNLSVHASDSESGVNSIVWNIQTPTGTLSPAPKEEAWKVGKNLTYIFNYALENESLPAGNYSITATLKDNAGNTVDTQAVGPYMLDCKKPEISIDPIVNPTIYQAGVDFDFLVTEGTEESGISKVTLYKVEAGDKVVVKTWLPANNDEKTRLRSEGYKIVKNGTYILEAVDVAGNVSSEERTFTKLSTVVPTAPEITVTGVDGNNNWFKGEDAPEATITCETTTSDGVPVTTKYKVTTTNTSDQSTVDAGKTSETFDIDMQGTVTIEAWSISESGMTSEVAKKVIKVDTDKPTAEIINASKDENGQLYVNFRLKDSVSGIDPSTVYVNGKEIPVTEEESGYVGKFPVSSDAIYQLDVEDIAGNEAETLEFVPLRLNAAPVTDISTTSAYVDAEVLVGTYDVNECYIAYRKHGESSYRTALYNKDSNGNKITLSYDFRDLTPDTVYDYKIFASNEKAEVCVEEGQFKTLATRATGIVYGTVTYDDSVTNKDYPVYVSLYDANTIIASKKLESESDVDYNFTNISDGSYRVVATNGLMVETAAVTLENGGVILPKDFAAKDGINLVLNGLNTEVVIEDNVISLTADDLESIYDNSIYRGILTDADLDVLQQGGNIKVTLHASYIDASALTPEEARTFKLNMAENAVIERYIQLDVIKEVWDKYGNYVNGTPTEIPELYNPITVSFPLGDLAGQKIYVASAHENNGQYEFFNWTTAPEAVISNNYVTIQTRYFSVYALYRIKPSDKFYNVTWKDGDGRVMKTESVRGGTAATAPAKTPTKTATANYTYKFTGWDTDYSNISKDIVILARFEAVPIKPDDEPTVTPPPADIVIPDNTPDKQPNAYTYLGSAESPKTGDATPIVLLVVMMGVAGVGMTVCYKKSKKENE